MSGSVTESTFNGPSGISASESEWESYASRIGIRSGRDTVCLDEDSSFCPDVMDDPRRPGLAGFTTESYSSLPPGVRDPNYNSPDGMTTLVDGEDRPITFDTVAGAEALPNALPDAENRASGLLPRDSHQIEAETRHSAGGAFVSRSNACFPRLTKSECDELGGLDHFNGRMTGESTTQWLQMPNVEQSRDGYSHTWTKNDSGLENTPGMCCRRPDRDGGIELPVDLDLMGLRRPK